MPTLTDFRAARLPFYPDQTIYAEYACHAFGLDFTEMDGGTGLAFTVGSRSRTVAFGAGRGSFFPQNNATAATLANDKYLADVVMIKAGIATLGGQYFFLHERYRAHRPPGHERADALACFHELGGMAFVKPLAGSRGDFAQTISSEPALAAYLDEVARYYDAVLMQPVFAGKEYRVFLLDGEVVFSARKWQPALLGDGVRTIRELYGADAKALELRGISSVPSAIGGDDLLDHVLPDGVRWTISGRMNRSAGGSMQFAEPDHAQAAFTLAQRAASALGLRAAAVDLFADIADDPNDVRVIEVNANPSIRFLEDSGRDDLILKIWRHTLYSIGLLDV
ncbi:hypothetical protein [Tardiphaga sp.]|uniref:ATP-grasp domain-containing protein n=1 Tax=Tardiphaga sp. TaxID=1926292 RepID=UPI002610293A|nr:hypothetical protein [Tardiphaga sp.]MDB5619710.1 hypothetical protein [Tardiphaga sp.]